MSPVLKGLGYGMATCVFILAGAVLAGFNIDRMAILLSLAFAILIGFGAWAQAKKEKRPQ
jgi:hypothetical protein